MRLSDNAHYLADLDPAISNFTDPLAPAQFQDLIRLHTARQVVHRRDAAYTTTDLQTLVWLGRGSEALAHARLQSSQGFAGIQTAYRALCERDGAAPTVLSELLALARMLEGISEHVAALHATAEVLVEAKDPRAVAVLEEAYAAARRIESTENRSEQVRSLTQLLARAGRLKRAIEMAHGIEDFRARNAAFKDLAITLAAAGQTTEAKAAVAAIVDPAVAVDAICDLVVMPSFAHGSKACDLLKKGRSVALRVPSESDMHGKVQ